MRFFPLFQIFFNDPVQEPAEDVFLTELRTQVQESISPRGVCVSPQCPCSRGCHPAQGPLSPAPTRPVPQPAANKAMPWGTVPCS